MSKSIIMIATFVDSVPKIKCKTKKRIIIVGRVIISHDDNIRLCIFSPCHRFNGSFSLNTYTKEQLSSIHSAVCMGIFLFIFLFCSNINRNVIRTFVMVCAQWSERPLIELVMKCNFDAFSIEYSMKQRRFPVKFDLFHLKTIHSVSKSIIIFQFNVAV